MTTMLITGGSVTDLVDLAVQHLNKGDKVVLFHEFPGDSLTRAPSGVEVVFNVSSDGMNSSEIADIYGAQRIVDLGIASTQTSPPQHLY